MDDSGQFSEKALIEPLSSLVTESANINVNVFATEPSGDNDAATEVSSEIDIKSVVDISTTSPVDKDDIQKSSFSSRNERANSKESVRINITPMGSFDGGRFSVVADRSESFSYDSPESYQNFCHDEHPDSYQSSLQWNQYPENIKQKVQARSLSSAQGEKLVLGNFSWISLLGMVCGVILISISVVEITKSSDNVQIVSGDDMVSDDTVSDVVTGSVVNATEALGSLTFNRYGYDPLGYFTDTLTSVRYKFTEKHMGIIEPSAEMSLFVLDSESAYTSDNTFYEFSVCTADIDTWKSTDDSTCYSGTLSASEEETATVTVPCTPFDIFTVTAKQRSYSDSSTVAAWEGTAVCTYVRRELRSLTSEDLATTMDAMYVLWSTPEDEGQELYGSNYHDSVYCE